MKRFEVKNEEFFEVLNKKELNVVRGGDEIVSSSDDKGVTTWDPT